MYANEAIHRFAIIDQSENCTGDYIVQSKNTLDSYYAMKCEDSRFLYDSYDHKNSYDSYESALECELQYESYGCNFGKNLKFCHISHESHDMCYTDYCFNSHDLFGCNALKRKAYCILNKQYTQEEYFDLLPRIFKHVQETGEWGEAFPMEYAPFAYNESVVNEFYPLNEAQIKKEGLAWKEPDAVHHHAGGKILIPDDVKDVQENILEQVLGCENCGRDYKLIRQEFDFYKKHNVPVPRFCFECRHQQRLYYRNPRKLWDRVCAKCSAAIRTSYAPDRPEKVYCESCYLKEV
jgi:hypothetical protein